MQRISDVIREYQKDGYVLSNPREVKSGKEATLFLVTWQDTDVALKVYVSPEKRSFQAMSGYIAGKYHRNPSERRAVIKKAKFGKHLIHKTWVQREFHMLRKMKAAGAMVPQVYTSTHNSILMEFIGEENMPAPRIIDVHLSSKQAEKALELLINNIQIFLKYGIIHGDLSPYNILWWHETPVIIDIPQAIDIRENPNKDHFLKRDIDNLLHYFKKFITVDDEAIYGTFGINAEV